MMYGVVGSSVIKARVQAGRAGHWAVGAPVFCKYREGWT